MGTDEATVALRKPQGEATAGSHMGGGVGTRGLDCGPRGAAPGEDTALSDGTNAQQVLRKTCGLPTLTSLFIPRSPLCPQLGPGSCHKLSSGLAPPRPVASWAAGASPRAFHPASGVRQTLFSLGRGGASEVLCKTAKTLLFGRPSSGLTKFFASHIKCFLSPA